MNPRKPIRKKSKAKAKQDRVYNILAKAFLIANPKCAVCGRPATEVHHIRPRSVRPDLVCDPDNFLAVCKVSHQFIHDHPALSYIRGHLKRSTDL